MSSGANDGQLPSYENTASWAVMCLRNDHPVRRRAWPPGMHLVLVSGHGLEVICVVDAWGRPPRDMAPWKPTDQDLLTDDWEVARRPARYTDRPRPGRSRTRRSP